MKKRDNLPLNYKERLNSRTSFLVSIAVLVVLCLVFNQMDYTMIRQPAAQGREPKGGNQKRQHQPIDKRCQQAGNVGEHPGKEIPFDDNHSQ